jgi:riboflavin kinase
VTLNTSKILCVEGKVFSGSGEGAKFIKLPWVRKQIAEKLGFAPYPGTLNIKLAKNSVKLEKSSKKAESIEISPVTRFCRGRCFKAYLMDDVQCAIVIPEVADYPEDVLEVVAPINLRQKYMLNDEDTVEIKIML